MKIVCKNNKKKLRRLEILHKALFACAFCLSYATCMAQVPDWSSDGPPRRQTEQQSKVHDKVYDEKAFQEKFKNDFVKKIDESKTQLRQSMAQARASSQGYNSGGGDIVKWALDSFVPSIPGPFQAGDIYDVVTSDRPLLTAGKIAANWGISQIDVPVVPTIARMAVDRVVDNYSGAIDAQYAIYQSQLSFQVPLNNITFRNSDQRALSASNFALGESVNLDETNLLVQRQTERTNERFGLAAFYKDGEEDKKFAMEKETFLLGLRKLDKFSDGIDKTFSINEELAEETRTSVMSGSPVDARSLVDKYITQEYFDALRQTTEIFSPELHDDENLLNIAQTFDTNSQLSERTWNDQYGQTHTVADNLFAADVFGRYGVVCMQRGRETSGEYGEELLATGESLLKKSLEIAEKRFASYPGYRAQWLTSFAIRCQYAGFNDRARELFEESENVAAKYLATKTEPKTTRTPTGRTIRTQTSKATNQAVKDVKTRRAWNAEMASRAMLLDGRFEDVPKYVDVVTKIYESWNASKYDAEERARLPRELYAEAKVNSGLAKFLSDFDVDARFQLQEAKEKFDQYAVDPNGRTSFVVEEQVAILCRLAQLASRVERYDDALTYAEEAIREKREFMEEQTKNWEGHRRHFTVVPAYFDAVYVEDSDEGCDADGNVYKLTEEDLSRRKELWKSIVESKLSYEKNLKASILFKRGDPKGDLKEALKIVDEILETLKTCGLDEKQAAAETLTTRAQIKRRLSGIKNLRAANEDLERASEILDLSGLDVEEFMKAPNSARAYFEGLCACERGHVERELAALNENGAAERAKELYDAAEQYFKKAIVSNAAWVDLYYGRATLRRLVGDKQAAYDDLNQAIERSLEVRKTSAVNDKDRALRLSQFSYLFEAKAAWTLEDSTNEQEGVDKQEVVKSLYQTMETARTQSFEDLATLANFDLTADVDEKTLKELNAKKAKVEENEKAVIDAENNLLRKAETKDELSTSSNEIESYEKALEAYTAARNEYNASMKKLARSIVVQAINATQTKGDFEDDATTRDKDEFEKIQTLATESNLVVCEYMLGENHSYLTVFGAGVEPRAYELNIGDRETQKLLRRTRIELESGALTAEKLNVLLSGFLGSVKDSSRKFRTFSNVLWTTLFPQELRDRICDKNFNSDLLIIPDGALSQLPFYALVVDDGEITGDMETYLLDLDPIISYAPSGWVYYELTKRAKKNAPENVLTVANPDTSYGELAHSETELQRIVECCANNERFKEDESCKSFVGSEATEKNVRMNLFRTFVHLAVHGDVDFKLGKWSGALILTPGSKAEGENVSENDGMLTMGEIMRRNMSECELAILSACNTNRSERQIDEGVWSIGRGILLAGARRVVASDWAVNDSSTSELISVFLQKVLDESETTPNIPRALKEAQRAVKKQDGWNSPYYWAPFVLIGAR